MTMHDLSQLYWLRRETDMLTERLARLRAAALAPASPKMTGGGHSGRGDRVAEQAVRLHELEALLEERRAELNAQALALERFISAVPDSLTRQIIQLHFGQGYSWGKTARVLGGGNTAEGVRQRVYRYVRGL